MKLAINIDLDNDAFQPEAGEEVARILRDAADRCERLGNLFDDLRANLRDVNGNTVGALTVK